MTSEKSTTRGLFSSMTVGKDRRLSQGEFALSVETESFKQEMERDVMMGMSSTWMAAQALVK
jgi:hypothetical protein